MFQSLNRDPKVEGIVQNYLVEDQSEIVTVSFMLVL